MPKISVIIPVYNKERFIRETMDSLLQQSLDDMEIIIAVGPSTDASSKIIENYAKEDGRISYFKTGIGAANARNEALERAQGEFVAFLDADDSYPDSCTLQLMYNNAVEHGVNICGGSLRMVNPDKVVDKFDTPEITYGNTFLKSGMMSFSDYQYDFYFQRFIYKRSFLLEHGICFPDRKSFEDPPFMVDAMMAAGEFYALKEITYCYRWGFEERHKEWDMYADTFADILRGMGDELKLSAEHGMARLHRLIMMRVDFWSVHDSIEMVLSQGNQEVLKEALRMYKAMNADMLQHSPFLRQRIADDIYHWPVFAKASEMQMKNAKLAAGAQGNFPMIVYGVGEHLYKLIAEHPELPCLIERLIDGDWAKIGRKKCVPYLTIEAPSILRNLPSGTQVVVSEPDCLEHIRSELLSTNPGLVCVDLDSVCQQMYDRCNEQYEESATDKLPIVHVQSKRKIFYGLGDEVSMAQYRRLSTYMQPGDIIIDETYRECGHFRFGLPICRPEILESIGSNVVIIIMIDDYEKAKQSFSAYSSTWDCEVVRAVDLLA